MRLFTSDSHGSEILETGVKMQKKRSPVYLMQVLEDFQVMTNEGLLGGKPGDFVAFDPLSKHVWPVSKEYVQMHYEPYEEPNETPSS